MTNFYIDEWKPGQILVATKALYSEFWRLFSASNEHIASIFKNKNSQYCAIITNNVNNEFYKQFSSISDAKDYIRTTLYTLGYIQLPKTLQILL
jgi:hypothetical protein